MDDLSTEILGHSRLRTVPCCLCGVAWEERLVGVALVAGLAVLGDLCPRCLRRGPADASARLKALLAGGPGKGLEGAHLCSLSRAIRARSADWTVENGRTHQEAADPLAPFLERLGQIGHWGTTVEQAIKAERRYFLRLFGPLHDQDLRRAVDDRYRDFLATSA
jgi:hypothetical protein